MFKFCTLYSSSGGNCVFIQGGNTKILIDVGVSMKKIISSLNELNIDISEITAILITHEHSDHIQSLQTICKKYQIPVYINHNTMKAICTIKEISEDIFNIFQTHEEFCIEDLKIVPFLIPHDAAEPCGYNIFYDNKKITIATDIGTMNDDILKRLDSSNLILLESNHDIEMVKVSSYPFHLKKRILGNYGHLSNELSSKTIAFLATKGIKNFVLGHLSTENNFPELALQTVHNEIRKSDLLIEDLNIIVAPRDKQSELIII